MATEYQIFIQFGIPESRTKFPVSLTSPSINIRSHGKNYYFQEISSETAKHIKTTLGWPKPFMTVSLTHGEAKSGIWRHMFDAGDPMKTLLGRRGTHLTWAQQCLLDRSQLTEVQSMPKAYRLSFQSTSVNTWILLSRVGMSVDVYLQTVDGVMQASHVYSDNDGWTLYGTRRLANGRSPKTSVEGDRLFCALLDGILSPIRREICRKDHADPSSVAQTWHTSLSLIAHGFISSKRHAVGHPDCTENNIMTFRNVDTTPLTLISSTKSPAPTEHNYKIKTRHVDAYFLGTNQRHPTLRSVFVQLAFTVRQHTGVTV
ncbi:hypothetical protein EDD18DRAFT_1112487 [Armillaria luteobubalina]|uniref:Uncharacterized protein n=1 Tax=Armillaria luteobubalina TaxID=153913 RepID=A0AA39PER2_9AGAR|nr:hypothetical protein EDD18DRAFT_1112487 [Armillaria luteobubalina]